MQKAQKKVIGYLLLGRYANSTMYPKPLNVYEAFKIHLHPDEKNYEEIVAFQETYGDGGEMMRIVGGFVCRHRGRMLGKAKTEMWRFFVCHRVPEGAPQTKIDIFKAKLERLHEGNDNHI